MGLGKHENALPTTWHVVSAQLTDVDASSSGCHRSRSAGDCRALQKTLSDLSRPWGHRNWGKLAVSVCQGPWGRWQEDAEPEHVELYLLGSSVSPRLSALQFFRLLCARCYVRRGRHQAGVSPQRGMPMCPERLSVCAHACTHARAPHGRVPAPASWPSVRPG